MLSLHSLTTDSREEFRQAALRATRRVERELAEVRQAGVVHTTDELNDPTTQRDRNASFPKDCLCESPSTTHRDQKGWLHCVCGGIVGTVPTYSPEWHRQMRERHANDMAEESND